MRKNFLVVLMLLFVAPGLLTVVSCSKKVDPKKDVAAGGETSQGSGQSADDKAKQAEQERLAKERELEAQRLREKQDAERLVAEARKRFVEEDAMFAYDSAILDDAAQGVLRYKAEWMQKNPDVAIVIEGHCDERGTTEYNIALGDKRAGSAKKFLLDLGIAAARMTTISYGEERPLNQGHDESAWASNRRAHVTLK